MELLYSQWIEASSSLHKRESAGHAYFSRLSRSVKRLQHLFASRAPRSVKVLDFGMGWGHWAVSALGAGFSCDGVEISRERRVWAKARGVRSFGSLRGLRRGEYDFVNADQVFEHLADPLGVLKDLVRVMAPGGYIRISVPNPMRELIQIRLGRWTPRKGAFHPLEHLNAFGYRSISVLAKRAGLVPVTLRHSLAHPRLIPSILARCLLRRPSGLFRKP